MAIPANPKVYLLQWDEGEHYGIFSSYAEAANAKRILVGNNELWEDLFRIYEFELGKLCSMNLPVASVKPPGYQHKYM